FRRLGSGFEVEVAGSGAGVAGESAGGVAGGLHSELARGVGVEQVVGEDSIFDDHGVAGRESFAVEGRGAESGGDGAVVDDRDGGRGDLLAEKAGEEGGSAIDAVSAGGVEDGSNEAAGDLGREDERDLLGLNTAR